MVVVHVEITSRDKLVTQFSTGGATVEQVRDDLLLHMSTGKIFEVRGLNEFILINPEHILVVKVEAE